MAVHVALEDTVVVSKDAIWCDLKGEVVVLQLSSGVYFGLEGVGPEMWQCMQVPCTVAEVADQLISRFDVDPEICRSSTLAFIGELAQRELVLVRKSAVAA